MNRSFTLLLLSVLLTPWLARSQNDFSVDAYRQFLLQSENLSAEQLRQQNPLPSPLYSHLDAAPNPKTFTYLDSIIIKYELTADEQALLQRNHFCVSERLSFDCFGRALHDIYINDLPVFITTDAVLHALHVSYDRLLMDIESSTLEPSLIDVLDRLHSAYPQLLEKYAQVKELEDNLGDVDTYLTVAQSLILGEAQTPAGPYSDNVPALLEAIAAEQLTSMPLFSERSRPLDFSQFTVRGHYTQQVPYPGSGKTLGNYFQCMMWLGRIDFLLTPPPNNPWEAPWSREEIRRMNISAFMLHELLDLAQVRPDLQENDKIIDFMVGKSDNLTPTEFAGLLASLQIVDARDLLRDLEFDRLQAALRSNDDYGQRILSNFFLMDPFSAEPDPLPISFRLSGQRFIIDSYILSNVVYDRIIFNGAKIWRPMPDPLDALFVLGNDAVLPLLDDELQRYHYAGQLAALRYLTDAFDPPFWEGSLYTVWLQALRTLNPPADLSVFPLFMQTTAWQQEKINTQLASWAQLRHDNLLYGKQSYTGGTGCSYPYSFVEPVPEFFAQIARFATIAGDYFASFSNANYEFEQVQDYFSRLQTVSTKLAMIAQKEIDGLAFDTAEIDWLKKMLFVEGGSGTPPFSGWYADLYYMREKAAEGDFVIADVHTQPTDQAGNVVGRIMHVGVGNINLGIVLAQSVATGGKPMAFVGPMLSYYNPITDNFKRLTDEEWTSQIEAGREPNRPDWVNSYLTNKKGELFSQGREIPGIVLTGIPSNGATTVESFSLQNYPNPFNPRTTIEYTLPDDGNVRIAIYDVIGRQVNVLLQTRQNKGRYRLAWSAIEQASGVYYCRIQTDTQQQTIKLLLLK